MVSDTLLRLALCVAQGSLDFDTLLRFVTLGDSESPVNRYTSVLRPLGLLNAPVMRYTSCVSCPSVLYHAHPCALCPIGRTIVVPCPVRYTVCSGHGVCWSVGSFHVRRDTSTKVFVCSGHGGPSLFHVRRYIDESFRV